MREERGIVLFGDVTRSRRDAARMARRLRALAATLDDVYGEERIARFGFTQGDELQGLLATSADPFQAVLIAALTDAGLPLRWAIAGGRIDRGSGPATQRTGEAFLVTRGALAEARARRQGLVVVSGDEATDVILADTAPLLAVLLGDLTDRQREIARLVLIDGLRQADVAARLGGRRPTVSVAVDRARIREIAGLARALRALLAEGLARTAAREPGAA